MTIIIRSLLFLTKQCLAIRGKNESKNINGRGGNFTEFMHFQAYTDSLVYEFIHKKKNNYLSSTIQNEILEILKCHIKQKIKK